MATATTTRSKRAEDVGGFADAVGQMQAAQLKADALKDVKNLGLLGLGVGAAGAGAVGLYNVLRRDKERKLHGPAVLPLTMPAKQAWSLGDFLSGGQASTKGGIPWYDPAMFGVGALGLGAGYMGTSALLKRRRKAEGEAELEKARQEFNDALAGPPGPKVASERSAMEKAGRDLDRLFDLLAGPLQKEALDLPNLGGQALGGYGVYAGLSGLLTGAVLYNQAKKRSRAAVLDAALKRRARRQFMQSPTHIEALPDQDAGATLDVTGGS